MAGQAEVNVNELRTISERARVFASMPWVPGVTPRMMADPEKTRKYESGETIERREGIFRMDEIGLSPLDHGGLYGDGVFEGILISGGNIWLFREHLERWYRSAELAGIAFPYPVKDSATRILETIRATGLAPDEVGYLRPVLSRGLGNLGINPAKCVAPTIYVIAATIRLYPPQAYETGIELSVARAVRRPGADVLNPNIKSCNYMNNVFALLETAHSGRLETLMLTSCGFLAEASADNIFLVHKRPGWESDPSKVLVETPSGDYCLRGITRGRIVEMAHEEGYAFNENRHMLPHDLVGPDRECFMTGTGAGVMPVVSVEGSPVGDGKPGPITRRLLSKVIACRNDPRAGLPVSATEAQLDDYLACRGGWANPPKVYM